MENKRVIKRKSHVEIHGLTAEQKADLVRLGVPLTTLTTGAILLPLNLPVGAALALGGTAASGILGVGLRDKIVGIFQRHHDKNKLKKVM
jgi:hypothetical protein